MSDGGLFDPLGTKPGGPGPRASRSLAIVVVVGSVALAGLAGTMALLGGDEGGEPVATASITRLEAPPPPATPQVAAPLVPAPRAPPGTNAGMTLDVDVENGVKVVRTVARGTGSSVGGTSVAQGASGPPLEPDPRLLEPSPYGPLPRIGADGTRPAVAYARPQGLDPPPSTRPRLAILIGGMGFDGRATAGAATSLPGAVTFAFDASGPDLEAQARQARGAGHEVLLQWPKGDDGGGAPPDRERARALLARFAGYAGVADPPGGGVHADAGDWPQILRDVGERGLLVVRDARRQPRPDEAGVGSTETPVVRIDVILDAPGDPASVAQALTRLESVARTRGIGAGSANADPTTLAILARYLATAAGRGFDLVPVSALSRAADATAVSFTRPNP